MKTTFRFAFGLLLILCGTCFSGFAQNAAKPATNPGSSNRNEFPFIDHFEVRDGLVHFVAELLPIGVENDSLRMHKGVEIEPGLDELSYQFIVDHGDSVQVYGELSSDRDSLVFTFPLPMGVFQGWHHFQVIYGLNRIFETKKMVKSQNSVAGQQPSIESVNPRGSLPGSTVTVRGKNFGNDLNNIYIWFTDKHDDTLSPAISNLINPIIPSFLTTTGADGYQLIKFAVPGREVWDSIANAVEEFDFFETELKMRVVVKGQPSANAPVLSVVKPLFRSRILLILGIIYGLVGLLLWYLHVREKKRNITRRFTLKSLIVDPDTNTLSLSRIQALAWTLMLMFSYSYFVIITFLILDKSAMPDFDPSLLILMGISTSGLLIARGQEKATPAALQEVAEKPSIWDLITEGGKISLASLQLALFTLVGLVMYLVYMTSPDLVETGLPTLPDTLLALMGISQGGFIGGKAVEISNRGNRLNSQVPANSENAGNPVVSATPQDQSADSGADPVKPEG